MEFDELSKEDWKLAEPLFADHQFDTVLIHSVLDGHTGRVLTDSTDSPTAARLDTGAFTMLGGNPKEDLALELIKHSPVFYTTPHNKTWASRLHHVYAGKITKLPFTEYHPDHLKPAHLQEIIHQLPGGYQLTPLDARLCRQMEMDLDNPCFFEHFVSINDFLQRGMGYGIVYEGKFVSGATSMAAARDRIDIEIETKEEFQQRGLGTVAGAALVLSCINQGISPQWLSANRESDRLAERLGLRKGRSYETFQIDG